SASSRLSGERLASATAIKCRWRTPARGSMRSKPAPSRAKGARNESASHLATDCGGGLCAGPPPDPEIPIWANGEDGCVRQRRYGCDYMVLPAKQRVHLRGSLPGSTVAHQHSAAFGGWAH